MRVDKFLNTVNVVKRRAVSEEMCKSGVVSINGNVAKAAKEIKVGDEIEIRFLEYTKRYKVLAIPVQKTIPKSAKSEYVSEVAESE